MKSLLGKECRRVNLVFSRASLSKFSLNALIEPWVYGYKYSRVRRNVKIQFFPNRVVWRLDLATGLSREFKPRVNRLATLGLFSYSATPSMTLQLPRMLHTCANFGGLPVASHP